MHQADKYQAEKSKKKTYQEDNQIVTKTEKLSHR